MANLGEIAEIVTAEECTLEVGSNSYVLIEDLHIHIGRTESRDVSPIGPVYSYGSGDNWFTGTLKVSTPELSSLNTLTQIDANGAMTSTAWKIVAKNVSGAAKTFAATGVLRDYDVKKPHEGKVKIDIFVRITGDTVTIS